MKSLSKLFIAGISLMTLAACGNQESKDDIGGKEEGKLNVVATNSIIADMAEQVGGG